MKKYSIVLVLVLCIVGICGFKVARDCTWQRRETDGLSSMKVKEGTLSEVGCTVVIENEETKEFPLGIQFWHIEKFEDGKWQMVPFFTEGRETHAMAYYVGVGDCQEHEIRWDYEVGSLSSGKYRIAVPIYTSTWREIEDYLYARFIIK